jgi:hypothetical protein
VKLNKNQKGATRIYLLAAIIAATIVLFIIGTIRNSDNRVGTGVEYTPSDGPAIMNESEDLYRLINNDSQFNYLKEDLAYFGRATIDDYTSGKEPGVIFVVDKNARKNGEQITFEGKFEKSKDTIVVTITKLHNGRIKSSVVNKKTNKNLDAELPSNSKRNQYVGSLPLAKDGFTVGFLEKSDEFFITLDGVSVSTEQSAAISELTTVLGIQDLSNENVTFVYWGANGLPVSLPNPDKAGD